MAEFLMPDISHHQLELSEARARDVTRLCRAIMFKASEGTGFVDPHFLGNAGAARAAGLPFGAYHYVNQGVGEAQAEHFWSTVCGTGLRFLCIDWESGDRRTVKDLASRLREVADVPVGVYAGVWARDHGGPPLGLDWAMVPAYGPSRLPEAYYPDPYPLAAWQYTNGSTNGTAMPDHIPGIGACDVSIVYRPRDMGLTQEDDEMTDEQLDQLRAATAALRGVDDFLADIQPPEEASPERKQMYRALRRAASQPAPVPPDPVEPHTHEAHVTVDPA